MVRTVVGALLLFLAQASGPPEDAVYQHVRDQANATFREPSGALKFKYVVPAGPYDHLWDWDSLFTGLALLEFGSAPYLEGSMLNFLDHTDSDGKVGGCLKPKGDTGVIAQAKPVVIQGAWLAAKETGGFAKFLPYRKQMRAMLNYWSSAPRLHNETGLRVWFDQMESGQDNLVISTCPSWMSRFSMVPFLECLWKWNPDVHELVMASPDLMTFLHREFSSFALFNFVWAASEADMELAKAMRAEGVQSDLQARYVKEAMDAKLWSKELGFYTAFNTSSRGQHVVTNRVSQMGMPLWAGLASAEQAAAVRQQLLSPDMLGPFGIRSASSLDPRYTDANVIIPYSNWRGPLWVNHNVFISYGLMRYGFADDAQMLADRVVATLANDLEKTGAWHECYHSEKGQGLAAPGFLSWNTLAASWHRNLRAGRDPFDLSADHVTTPASISI